MPNYAFAAKEDEMLAHRMVNIRAVFCMCATCGLIGPVMTLAFGFALRGLDGDTWVSVPIVDSDGFRDLANPYVCQMDGAGGCPSGSTVSSDTKRCYKFHEEHATWKDAIAKCKAEGGVLACIHSAEDNEVIHDFCKEDTPCWIGLSRLAGALWYWDDLSGSPAYENWADGHPVDPKDVNPDDGAYAVLGYARWAAGIFVMGLLSFIFITLQLMLIVLIFWMNNKGLRDKSTTCMCAVITFDGVQAGLLFLAFIFSCVAAKDAKDHGLGGVVVTILFAFAEFAIVAYLVYAGMKLRGVMQGSFTATSTE